MPRLAPLAALLLLAGSLVAAADPTAPSLADEAQVVALVGRLGHPDYSTREAAVRELDAIGAAALERLRPACRSANPEVARRARLLVARIERRIENEEILAPTVVELAFKGAPLSDVLADLSLQSKYNVNFGVASTDAVNARTPVTMKTGKVPFWAAVLAVCDAADLRVASVSGYVAPGAPPAAPKPPFDRTGPGGGRVRLRPPGPPGSPTAIVLEPRGAHPKRPAAASGSVLVEAFPIPAVAAPADAPAALLQVWPEPKLGWLTTKLVQVSRAADGGGQLLAAVPTPTPEPGPLIIQGNGVVFVQQVGGGVVLVNQRANVPADGATAPAFTPNDRQAVVKLKPGEKPSDVLAEFAGKLHGTTRSPAETLIRLPGLKSGQTARGSHPAGADMVATLGRVGERWQVTVELGYDPATVYPGGGDDGRSGRGRRVMDGSDSSPQSGIRVTDADGNAFSLSPTSVGQMLRPGVNAPIYQFTFSLSPSGTQAGDPDAVSFVAGHARPVEVPFALKGVPLAGGKK